jgi:hypothetical protein
MAARCARISQSIMRAAWLVSLLVMWASGRARADAPCTAESEVARKDAGRDPSLAKPSERAAVEHMRSASVHLEEGMKRAAVVETRDQAAAEYRAAIDRYVAAAMISSAPVILYNLALTYRAAGDYPRAIEQYRLFMDRGKPGPALRALIECHIATMTAELERAASTAPPTEPVPVDDPDPPPPPPPPTPRAPPWYRDPVAWTVTGTGVAVTGVGVFLLLDAADLREQSEMDPRDAVRRELLARADRRETWGTVVTVGGAALVAAGVVKLVFTPDAPRDERPRVSLRVVPGGLVLGGTF